MTEQERPEFQLRGASFAEQARAVYCELDHSSGLWDPRPGPHELDHSSGVGQALPALCELGPDANASHRRSNALA